MRAVCAGSPRRVQCAPADTGTLALTMEEAPDPEMLREDGHVPRGAVWPALLPGVLKRVRMMNSGVPAKWRSR